MGALLDSITTHGTGEVHAPEKPIKAFAWARVSTDMQEDKGLSMPEQIREIRGYAEKNGIEIVAEFSEAASAFQKKTKRVEFDRMLEMARSDRDIQAIVVHDLSRFSRDSVDAQILMRDLNRAGVRVISVTDPDIDRESVAGVYMQHILLAKNEAYSREIAFHTRKGCKSNIQTRDSETGWCYKNGGQPIWGYRIERLNRGELKRGRPLIKSIWVPDDRIVAGKPVHEWARYCLVEMAAKGATLDELREFCNRNGIPAPRQQYWGHTTWNSLLHPHCLLEYAGYGVWNVRGKSQRYNPPSEWIVVENAHQALITEDEATKIALDRRHNKRRKTFPTSNRTVSSPYLLSGGMFVCGRCGSNMIGYRRGSEGTYYVCGSQPYRKGVGCGRGVYVPQEQIEREVMTGAGELIRACADVKGLVREINDELIRTWQASCGYDPNASDRLEQIDAKIANIRNSIEDGLADTSWANERLRDLMAERDELAKKSVALGEPPRMDSQAATSYLSRLPDIAKYGNPAEKKRLIEPWVDQIQLTPDTREVEINYQVPESVVNRVGAGVGFEPTTFGL